MDKFKIFYHDDNDGICSAAIVNRWLRARENAEKEERTFVKVNYINEYLPQIEKGDCVILVDFTPKNIEWDVILKKASTVTWIDHHNYPVKTALEYLAKRRMLPSDGNPNLFYHCHSIKAACELTWEFFSLKEDFLWPDDILKGSKDMLDIVKLLGDYDAWRFKFANRTWYAEYGVQAMGLVPESKEWDILLNWKHPQFLDGVLGRGEIVKGYLNNHYRKLVENIAFYTEFEGYNAVACNFHEGTSELFKGADENTFDFMIIFMMKGEGFKISLRVLNDHVNVGEIARKHGGNGHDKSAGFYCKELPFKLGGPRVVMR